MYKLLKKRIIIFTDGWWWITQILEQWYYTMISDDGEFFNYLNTDYCAVAEEYYYDRDHLI